MRLKKALLVLPLTVLLFACGKKTTTKIPETTRIEPKTTIKPTTVDNMVNISFLDDNGKVLSTKKIEKGSTISELKPSDVEGKKFVGWFYNGSSFDFNNTITTDMILIGKWENLKYDFEIKSDVTTYDYNPSATYNQEIVLSAREVMFYEFDGWYDGETLLSSKTDYKFNMPAKNLTIKAKYKPIGDADKFNYGFEHDLWTLSGAISGATFGSVVVVPEGVNIVGKSSLMSISSDISLLVLPDSLTRIEENGLIGPVVDAMVVGKNLISIGSCALDGTGMSRIYYKGTPDEWSHVFIDSYVTITKYMLYYYSEDEPTSSSYNYWHYDDNGSPVVWGNE